MKRREFLKLSTAAIAVAASSGAARAQTAAKEVRIGYQKTGVLVIARQQGTLETRFAASGVSVKWIEFTSGPPLLEAISNGAADFGAVGDSRAGCECQYCLCGGIAYQQRTGDSGSP